MENNNSQIKGKKEEQQTNQQNNSERSLLLHRSYLPVAPWPANLPLSSSSSKLELSTTDHHHTRCGSLSFSYPKQFCDSVTVSELILFGFLGSDTNSRIGYCGLMWEHRKSGAFPEIEQNLVKEGGKNPGSCETEVPVSGTRATDASMEHKSDLTVEKGNPISNQKVFPGPPVHSKISRPRSSATDIDVMSKRPAIFSEGRKQSALHQPPFLPVSPNQQILMFGGAHSSSDKYLANGHNHIRTYGSLDASLPKSSLMGCQKSEINISGSHPHHSSASLINASDILSYKWENSVPFRPSFSWPKPDSSVQTLYDPLADSTNSPDNADSEDMKISPENSPAAVSNNQSGIGENSPDYNQYNYLHKVKPKLAPLEEASNEVSSGNGPADSKTRPAQPANGELAELKAFRIALAEFIKELVKPAWKNGILSVDAHKMVVKKASDKVISSVQPHQMPNSQEAVKQYISMYRPKIEKLVEGYLEMYRKNGRPINPKNEVSCIGSSS